MQNFIFRCCFFVILVFASLHLAAQDLNGAWIDTTRNFARYKIVQAGNKLQLIPSSGNISAYAGEIAREKVKFWYVLSSMDNIPKTYRTEANETKTIPDDLRRRLLNDSIKISGTVTQAGNRAVKLDLTAYIPRYNATSSQWEKNPVSITLISNPIYFINKYKDTIELSTDISHPKPEVKLEEFSLSGVSVSGNSATISLRGKITDAIADIVDQKADIRQVNILYADPAAGTDDDFTEKTIALQKTDDGAASPWRPYPFAARLNSSITIPVWPGEVNVYIKATNIIGYVGYDGFTLHFDTTLKLVKIKHHKGSDPGFFNPVMVSINDPSINAYEEIPDIRLSSGRIKLMADAVARNGSFISETPVIALSRPAPEDIPNLVTIAPGRGSSTFRFRRFSEELYWAYTTHSPPNYFYYAPFTTVEHEVRNEMFNDWEPTAVDVVRNYEKDKEPVTDMYVKEALGKFLPAGNGLDAGYIVKMDLQLGGEKILHFKLRNRNNPNETKEVLIGAFEVLHRMKVVLVTVDGLDYVSISKLLRDPDKNVIPAFKKIFRGGINHDKPALSALPTITWCNWPGILSMSPPREHGITGNAFFERERNADPFGCSIKNLGNLWLANKGAGISSSTGGLTDHAKDNAGSLYDSLAISMDLTTKLEAISIHQWYKKHQEDRVDMDDIYFTRIGHGSRLVDFVDHSETAARLMDRITSREATEKFCANENVDVMAVYFPGPDNIAHAIGGEANEKTGDYTEGPKVPDDKNPVYATAEHVTRHTDRHLQRLIDSIDNRGYLYGTIFALVADHGLHSYHNKENFNLTMNAGFDDFFEDLGYEVYSGMAGILPERLKKQDIVYAANGGMAQIYINSYENWQKPPSDADIELIASRLFIEGMGGSAKDPQTGNLVDYTKPPMSYKLAYDALWPKNNEAFNNRKDNGALGMPPAIFVKICASNDCKENGEYNNFKANFRWVEFVSINGTLKLNTIDAFLQARQNAKNANGSPLYPRFSWPDFKARLDELNDKNPAGSRTGDIIIFTDGYAGYLTINDGDGFNGWHGGPSESESLVPLIFNIPGTVVKKDFIQNAVNGVYAQTNRRYLRNWELGKVLKRIFENFHKR